MVIVCIESFLIFFLEIKIIILILKIIIEWIENNYEIFTSFFCHEDIINVSKEQLAKEEYEYTKKQDSWGGYLQINIFFCILFNLNVAVFNERNSKYTIYFLFHNEEIIILLYVNNNHYNLIYPKSYNMKDKKLYDKPEDVQIENKIKSHLDKSTYKIKVQKYVIVNYIKSNNIYNGIHDYLLSIESSNVIMRS